jgi:hypothetical protein
MPAKPRRSRKAKKTIKVRRIKRPRRLVNYTPRVIIKFYNDVDLPEDPAALQQLMEQGKLGPWNRLKDKGIKIQRLITKYSRQSFSDLLIKAQQMDPTFHPHRFDTYFVVTFPAGVDASEVKSAFDSWQRIEDVYLESEPTEPPQVNRMGSTFGADQKYLDSAREGIDAECAWTISGGNGAGVDVQFLDLERGWVIKPKFPFNHQNLDPLGQIPLVSGNNFDWFGHGTAVLSIVVGRDNGTECVGIVPKLSNVKVASIIADAAGTRDRYNALSDAIEDLSFGDVLLIEDQISVEGYSPRYGAGLHGNLPVELDNSLFKLIQQATSNVRGITVIEAAGNGWTDLDSFEPSSSLFWGQEPSGAIIVAAASVPQSLRITAYSALHNATNTGSRIDCFAWGDQIPVAGDGTHGTGPQDHGLFGGTSGAAAIIAGAALALQGIAQANNLRPGNPKSRFAPSELRSLLSNPSTGTTSRDKIGVMPDLRQILRSLGFQV